MTKTKKINLPIIFHYYKNRKENMSELRIWFIARHILDISGEGRVCLNSLGKSCNLTVPYLKSICINSKLFRHIGPYIYYCSANKIKKMHGLQNGKIRGEKITNNLINQLKTKKKFQGLITKYYVECDLDRKHKNKITKGRISYQHIANYFNISRGTAKSNIQQGNAKYYKNILHYPEIKFSNPNEFNNWLLNNLDKKIGKYKIENNPLSYRLKFKNGQYILTQELPHIYKFTGAFLVNERGLRGNI